MPPQRFESVLTTDRLKICFKGREDANGEEYYFTTCFVPVHLDLNSAVIHCFPWEDKETGEYGLDLVFRKYDPDYKQRRQQSETTAKRRRFRPSREEQPDGGNTQ
jgi:hypothetical protein